MLKKLLETLRKGAVKLEELRQTLTELGGLDAQLRGEAERLAKSLENIDPRILLAVQPEGKHLPVEDAARLQRLNGIKEKISLLPGARANVERKAQALETELEDAYVEVYSAYRTIARSGLDNELLAATERELPKCGGNPRRAMLAAQAAAEHGEAKLWLEWFSSRDSNGDILGRIQKLLGHIARFDSGGAVRPASKTAIESGKAAIEA